MLERRERGIFFEGRPLVEFGENQIKFHQFDCPGNEIHCRFGFDFTFERDYKKTNVKIFDRDQSGRPTFVAEVFIYGLFAGVSTLASFTEWRGFVERWIFIPNN